jgi:hypothetical protein
MRPIFLPGSSLSCAPYIDDCLSSGSVQSIRILRVPSLAAPLSKPQDKRPASRAMRRMLNETALTLALAGLEDLVSFNSLLLAPVAPKLLRDRAEDRLSIGGQSWCRCERCGSDNLDHLPSPSLVAHHSAGSVAHHSAGWQADRTAMASNPEESNRAPALPGDHSAEC